MENPDIQKQTGAGSEASYSGNGQRKPRVKIRPLPDWIRGHRLSDSQILQCLGFSLQVLKPHEILQCWFCYRTTFCVWDSAGVIRCASQGACGTYYLVDPHRHRMGMLGAPYRLKCDCGGLRFKLRQPGKRKCTTCKQIEILPFFVIFLGAILTPIELGDRQAHKQLTADGGPSWQPERLIEFVSRPDGFDEIVEKITKRRIRKAKWSED